MAEISRFCNFFFLVSPVAESEVLFLWFMSLWKKTEGRGNLNADDKPIDS